MSSTNEPAAASASEPSQHSSHHSRTHPDGFVLSHLSRDFFTAYYQQQHQQTVSDQEILTLVNQAHDTAIAHKHAYRCIREYQFCYPRVMLHPHYQQLIQHNAKVAEVRVLDVGSCMGTDLRQMLLHGVKPEHALGLELNQDLIDIGLDVLYNDRSILQSSFATQDVLADDFLSNSQLSTFHTDGIDVIYCGSVYHLLEETPTHVLSKHLYQLLKPGGVLFGRTVGSLDATQPVVGGWNGLARFLHSADTFKRMLLQYGFVDVEFVPTASDMGHNNPVKVAHGKDDSDDNLERKGTGMHAFYARKAHV